MKQILIYGSKVFGQVIKDLVLQCGHNFVGFIDDYSTGEEIVGTFDHVKENFSKDNYEIIIAVGYLNLQARWSVYQKVISEGYRVATLIHPKAYVRNFDKVGNGCIIMAGTIVDINAEIKDLVVIWPGVVINHDSNIDSNTFLSPNSTICGCVKIGKNCFVGAGSVIVDHTNVPDDSFIKAGSVFYIKKS